MPITKKGQKKWLLSLVIIGLSPGLFLIVQRRASADNVVQGYSSKLSLQPGEVVSLDNASARTVKPAPADNTNLIYGVVVDPSDAPFAIVDQGSQVFIATSGTYQVLVTTSGGPINSGDYISMSHINGIGAKAQPGQQTVLGKAASGFDGSSNVISSSGGVSIGKVYVSISTQKSPIATTDPSVPLFLRKVTDAVTGKTVPIVRVYTALLLFLISLLATIVVLWSGVRSSLISLGRNPLSRKVIFSGMYKVIITGVGVFIIGLAGVYLLLKV